MPGIVFFWSWSVCIRQWRSTINGESSGLSLRRCNYIPVPEHLGGPMELYSAGIFDLLEAGKEVLRKTYQRTIMCFLQHPVLLAFPNRYPNRHTTRQCGACMDW